VYSGPRYLAYSFEQESEVVLILYLSPSEQRKRSLLTQTPCRAEKNISEALDGVMFVF
jgi:hypothetical protein